MSTDYGLASSSSWAPSYEKDPSDVIDYSLSWHFLGTDTISTSTWTADGLTVDSSSTSGLVTTVFASGGTDGSLASLTNTIVTSSGRTLQRTVYIAVKDGI
jgi:hypothetical protein